LEEEQKMTEWKDMTGEERYRVVEMARSGAMQLKDICETFQVSRQMLDRAIAKMEEAAMEALEPKAPGRKPATEEAQRITELLKKAFSLEQDLEHWKKRYEVAQTFIDILRDSNDAAPKSTPSSGNAKKRKKKRPRRKRVSRAAGEHGTGERLAKGDDGAGAQDDNGESVAADAADEGAEE
jgi:transposase-like protein